MKGRIVRGGGGARRRPSGRRGGSQSDGRVHYRYAAPTASPPKSDSTTASTVRVYGNRVVVAGGMTGPPSSPSAPSPSNNNNNSNNAKSSSSSSSSGPSTASAGSGSGSGGKSHRGRSRSDVVLPASISTSGNTGGVASSADSYGKSATPPRGKRGSASSLASVPLRRTASSSSLSSATGKRGGGGGGGGSGSALSAASPGGSESANRVSVSVAAHRRSNNALPPKAPVTPRSDGRSASPSVVAISSPAASSTQTVVGIRAPGAASPRATDADPVTPSKRGRKKNKGNNKTKDSDRKPPAVSRSRSRSRSRSNSTAAAAVAPPPPPPPSAKKMVQITRASSTPTPPPAAATPTPQDDNSSSAAAAAAAPTTPPATPSKKKKNRKKNKKKGSAGASASPSPSPAVLDSAPAPTPSPSIPTFLGALSSSAPVVVEEPTLTHVSSPIPLVAPPAPPTPVVPVVETPRPLTPSSRMAALSLSSTTTTSVGASPSLELCVSSTPVLIQPDPRPVLVTSSIQTVVRDSVVVDGATETEETKTASKDPRPARTMVTSSVQTTPVDKPDVDELVMASTEHQKLVRDHNSLSEHVQDLLAAKSSLKRLVTATQRENTTLRTELSRAQTTIMQLRSQCGRLTHAAQEATVAANAAAAAAVAASERSIATAARRHHPVPQQHPHPHPQQQSTPPPTTASMQLQQQQQQQQQLVPQPHHPHPAGPHYFHPHHPMMMMRTPPRSPSSDMTEEDPTAPTPTRTPTGTPTPGKSAGSGTGHPAAARLPPVKAGDPTIHEPNPTLSSGASIAASPTSSQSSLSMVDSLSLPGSPNVRQHSTSPSPPALHRTTDPTSTVLAPKDAFVDDMAMNASVCTTSSVGRDSDTSSPGPAADGGGDMCDGGWLFSANDVVDRVLLELMGPMTGPVERTFLKVDVSHWKTYEDVAATMTTTLGFALPEVPIPPSPSRAQLEQAFWGQVFLALVPVMSHDLLVCVEGFPADPTAANAALASNFVDHVAVAWEAVYANPSLPLGKLACALRGKHLPSVVVAPNDASRRHPVLPLALGSASGAAVASSAVAVTAVAGPVPTPAAV